MTTKRKKAYSRSRRRADELRPVRYKYLSALLLSCTVLLLLFLFGQLLSEQRNEQKSVRMMASLPSQDITRELYLKIQDFPGLVHCWAVYGAQAEIRIGSYQASAEILGIDLSAWPLKITKSAGKKRLGSAPLLVAGEGFFQSLADEYGSPVTKRQAQVFQEKAGTLDVEITLLSNAAVSSFSAGETSAAYANGENPLYAQDSPVSYGTAGAASSSRNVLSSEDSSSIVYKDVSSGSGAPVSFTGSFLALSDDDKLYMDAAQMRGLLKACGLPAGLSRVCLEIKGKQNAENAKKSLTKAGFLVL